MTVPPLKTAGRYLYECLCVSSSKYTILQNKLALHESFTPEDGVEVSECVQVGFHHKYAASHQKRTEC